MEYPPPSLAVMWFVNVRETKPRSKKKNVFLSSLCFLFTWADITNRVEFAWGAPKDN